MSQCQSTATLRLDGIDVKTLRCEGFAEVPHEVHRVTLTWSDAEGDAAALLDPDEDFDVEVDALPHDEVIEARIESRAVGDDLGRDDELIPKTPWLDSILDAHRASIRRQADEAAAARADRARGE